jgi:hypothetical protein
MHLTRRAWIKTVIAAAALMPGGMAALLARAVQAQSGTQSFNQVSGTVRVNGQIAVVGTPVGLDDRITTELDGEGVFIVGADAFLVRGASEVELSGEGVVADTLSVVTGAILGVFGPRKQSMTIDTPLATAGIRGTAAYTISDPTRSYICICYGTAELASKAVPSAAENIQTSHHESPRYFNLPGQGPAIEPAGMIGHNDVELAMLEALVGRTTPSSWLDLTPEQRYEYSAQPNP